MKKIITIDREFGSGGREFGKRLAELLNIAYYDEEIIDEISDKTDLALEYVRSIVEKAPPLSFPITIGQTFSPILPPYTEQNSKIYVEQAEIIKELASRSDCVIVGRCADYILKDSGAIRIFVYADMEHKVKRCQERSPENEKLSNREMAKKIKAVDRDRRKYYEFFTGEDWNDRLHYDFLINTSNKDIKELTRAFSQIFDINFDIK